MSEVLYRKYRPKKFSEVVGQDHIVEALSGAIKTEKISHAYLFTGSRGTGKTSIARILARELGTSANDIFEIDAASNTSVEDIRALNDSVAVLPFESKYKFYIIDEVHMLSKSAFNAFLKTLEEPPKHVIFVLATTEMEKLPDTIISRCETHHFKRPTQKILADVVSKAAKKEGYTLEKSSAELISLLAEGSFRDAYGILQKVISASKDKKITVEEVEIITGAPSSELVLEFLKTLVYQETERGIGAISKATEKNIDMRVFLNRALAAARFLLLLKHAPEIKQEIEKHVAEDDLRKLEEIAADSKAAVNSKIILELLDASERMRFAGATELPLELAVINLCGNVE